MGIKVGLDGSKILQSLGDPLASFLVLRNSKFSFTTLLTTFCKCVMFLVAVITIGGGLPVLPGVAFSWGLASVPEKPVSMMDVVSVGRGFWLAPPSGWCLLRQPLRPPMVFLKSGPPRYWCVTGVPFASPNLVETFLLSRLFHGWWCDALACTSASLQQCF